MGALLTSSASQKVLSATWEMSTIMPSRFISRTTSLPKAGEAVVMLDALLGHVAGGIRPVVGVGVRQRHVADAQGVIVAQQAQAVLDRVAALNAHQRRDLAAAVRLLDILDAGGEHEIVGIFVDDVVLHRVDHLQSPVGGVVPLDVPRGHINGEELRGDAAFLQPNDVRMPGAGARADVQTVHGPAGDVVVRVDEHRGAVDAHHLGIGDGAVLGRQPSHCYKKEKKDHSKQNRRRPEPAGSRHSLIVLYFDFYAALLQFVSILARVLYPLNRERVALVAAKKLRKTGPLGKEWVFCF